jgi:hypothetical protein
MGAFRRISEFKLLFFFFYFGAQWKKLSSPFHHTRNSVFETPGEKPCGSRAAQVVGASLEPPGFSPGVSRVTSLVWMSLID